MNREEKGVINKYVSERTTKEFRRCFFKALSIYEQNFSYLNLSMVVFTEIVVNVFRFYIKKYFERPGQEEIQKFIGVLLIQFLRIDPTIFPGVTAYEENFFRYFNFDQIGKNFFIISEANFGHFEKKGKNSFIKKARDVIASNFRELKFNNNERELLIGDILNLRIIPYFEDPNLADIQVLVAVLILILFQIDSGMVPELYIPSKDKFNPKNKIFETNNKQIMIKNP